MIRAIVRAKSSMDQPSTSTIDPFEELTNEWKVMFGSCKEQAELTKLFTTNMVQGKNGS